MRTILSVPNVDARTEKSSTNSMRIVPRKIVMETARIANSRRNTTRRKEELMNKKIVVIRYKALLPSDKLDS